MKISQQSFGKLPSGQTAELFTLDNDVISASITNYGGIVTHLTTPDRNSQLDDVVLGYDNLEAYVTNNPYFGCITGRFANRIKAASFSLNGKTYQLEKNDGNHHLHGGLTGLDKQLWKASAEETTDSITLTLRHTSPDGTGGYPGNLHCIVTYRLFKEKADLSISYRATTDQPTPVNLTHHSYFNLAGASSGSILDHELTLHAQHFTPVNSTGIPLGTEDPVSGTPLDFTTPHRIGERIRDPHPQLYTGYDHNWIIDHSPDPLTHAATLHETTQGRTMEVWTDQPAIQCYSGNFLDGSHIGKNNTVYHRHHGLCLETQLYPDSPNNPTFPNCILHPGKIYQHECIYRFSNQ